MEIRAQATTSRMRLIALFLAVALVTGVAPAAASTLTETRQLEVAERFTPALEPTTEMVAASAGPAPTGSPSAERAGFTAPAVRAQAPLPQPVATRVAPRSARVARTPSGTTAQGAASPATQAAPAATSRDTLAEARAILASRIAAYPILQGTTVQVGDTRGNPQGIVYFKSARIIINPNHTVSLTRIIDHEIWHIIDWRDNGSIDWGENVPPANASSFRN